MSMSLTFQEHSYYLGHAIMRPGTPYGCDGEQSPSDQWQSIYYDGVKGRWVEREAETLKCLKDKIRKWHIQHNTGYGERLARRRLEELRAELRAERISYGELAELSALARYIADDDVELLEAAGVPEGQR